MEPFAAVDIKRRRKREFSGSNSGGDFIYELKDEYKSRIRYLEKILPTISEKWLKDIILSIKKHFEQIVKSVDSVIEIKEILYNNRKTQNRQFDSKLQEKVQMYRKKLFDLEKEVLNPKFTLPKNLREVNEIKASLISLPPKLENVLPTITEQWLKDIILSIKKSLEFKVTGHYSPMVRVNKAPKATYESTINFLKRLKWYELQRVRTEQHSPISRNKKERVKKKYYTCTYKIFLAGEPQEVKTALTHKSLTNLFKSDTKMTIGVDFEVKSMEINGKKVKLQIWDCPDTERSRFLLPTY